jgi:hypothetical protein
VLAFAATANRATAVLTGPAAVAGTGPLRPARSADTRDMVRVRVQDRPLTATAALVWSVDLPRQLQQILFDTAYDMTPPALAG